MRKFDEKTGLESGRRSVLFTAAALEASGRHERLAKALSQQLARWSEVDAARRAAEDRITRANAGVAWCDFALDHALKGFANELLRDVRGDASDKGFREFFPEAPSEVIRLGLEAEVARCEAIFVVAAKRKVTKGAVSALAMVRAAVEEGRKALAARRAAYAGQAEASLDVETWKESADAVRQSVHVQLQAWAIENGEDRSYADRFFPEAPTRRAKAQPKGEGGGGGAPTT